MRLTSNIEMSLGNIPAKFKKGPSRKVSATSETILEIMIIDPTFFLKPNLNLRFNRIKAFLRHFLKLV